MAASIQLKTPAPAALREGRPPVRDRLVAMLLLTALAHAIVLLGVSFTSSNPFANRSPELDVLLVTDEVPEARANEHAAYLAQRTQLGAGNGAEALHMASPSSRGALVPPRKGQGGEGPANARLLDVLDRQLLTSSGESPDILYIGNLASASSDAPAPLMLAEAEGAPRSGRGDAVELLLRGKSDAQHWVTPDTRASRLAPYLAAWKRKVERVGTLNFPNAARTSGLSGSPVIEVTIGANGRLVQARVRRSSGYGALDQAAMAILKLASPFDPFPAELADDYARLRFAYEWEFVAGALQTGAVTVSSDTQSGP